VPQADRTAPGVAGQGEGLRQQPIERLAALGPIAQGQALLAKLIVVQLGDLPLVGFDLGKQ
jgi:hypothetical protein